MRINRKKLIGGIAGGLVGIVIGTSIFQNQKEIIEIISPTKKEIVEIRDMDEIRNPKNWYVNLALHSPSHPPANNYKTPPPAGHMNKDTR